MYEIRAWVIPPVLKEVICRVETLEEVKTTLIDLKNNMGLSNTEIFEALEVEDLSNGKLNMEALL